MRLYITGGTGLVGSNVIRLARQRDGIEIIASQYGPEPEWDYDYQLDSLDISNTSAISESLKKYKPDVVIHCAAFLDMAYMYYHREQIWNLFVNANLAFARTCAEIGARYIFVSTDWVFDGQEDIVTEDSPPHPVNFYGIMKTVCERDIMGVPNLSYGIGRLAGVYGLNYSNPSLLRKDNGLGFDFINYVIDQLSNGRVAEIWTGPKVNEVAHGTLASDGADMLLRLAEHDGNGIFHCWGSEAISRLQLAHHLADLFDVNHALIAPIPTDPKVLDAHRHVQIPFRIVTSTEKTAKALGREAFNIEQGLHDYKKQWDAFNSPTI